MARRTRNKARKAANKPLTISDLMRMYAAYTRPTSDMERNTAVDPFNTVVPGADTDVFAEKTMDFAPNTSNVDGTTSDLVIKTRVIGRRTMNMGRGTVVRSTMFRPFAHNIFILREPTGVLAGSPRLQRMVQRALWCLLPVLGLLFATVDTALASVRAEVERLRQRELARRAAFDALFTEAEVTSFAYPRDLHLPPAFGRTPIGFHQLPAMRAVVHGIEVQRWDHRYHILVADVVVNERPLPPPLVPARTWVVPPVLGHARPVERPALFARPPPAAHTC